MSKQVRVCLYLRVSTQDQDTSLQSYELERFCTARGFSVVSVYEDKATGTNAFRPQFQTMLRAALNREFDVIAVWKLDRFARSLKDLVTHLNELSEVGVEFVSLKDNVDLTTSAGKLMAHILGAFGQFEADLIRERVLSGLANAKRKGTKLGRPKVTNDTKVLELRQSGLSLAAIAKQLGISKAAVHKSLSRKSVTNPSSNIESKQQGVEVNKL